MSSFAQNVDSLFEEFSNRFAHTIACSSMAAMIIVKFSSLELYSVLFHRFK